jgi:TRAP-type uncharacterized transport system fused permease subunit
LLVAQGFDLYIFFETLISAMIGIALIGVSFAGYWLKTVTLFQRWYLGTVSLLFIAPGLNSSMIGFFLILPIIFLQVKK